MMNNGNNMMGMGRGASGMMMSGQGMPQMGMPGMPNAMTANLQAQQMMQQDQQQLQNNNSQQVMQIILRKLQQEPPRPGGWWRGVGISERVQNTQRVLLALHRGLGLDLNSALNGAQAFESEQFNVSQTKEQYDMAMKNKFQQIGMQAQQRGGIPGLMQPVPGGLNMMMPQAGQPNNTPNQNFNPNMMNPNMQPTMMPNGLMAQQPQPRQLPVGMMANSGMPNAMQIAQARAGGMPMQPQPNFSHQEQQLILGMAERIYNTWGPNEKEAAKTKFNPRELMAMQSRNEDPALILCRRQAVHRYLEIKRNQMNQQHQASLQGPQFGGIAGGMPGGMGGGAMVNGQTNGLVGHPNAPQMGPRPPSAVNPAFKPATFEDIRGQQVKAMQEQQEGRTVVPASQQRPAQPAMGLPQNNNLTPAQQQNPAFQQALNNQRLMQNRVPQPAMRVPMPQQGPPAGQPTPQPSPAPHLNRGPNETPRLDNSNHQQQPPQLRGPQQPMHGGRVGPSQPANNQHQPPQTKMSPQPMVAMNKTMSNMGMPDALQMRLAQAPPAERAQLVAKWRAQQQQQQQQQQQNLRDAQAAAGQSANTNQPSATAPMPAQSTAQQSTQQSAQNPTAAQPPMHNIGIRPGLANVRRMTPEERAFMDARPFHARVLQVDNLAQRINPDQIKTWGQLKTWLSTTGPSQDTVTQVVAIQEKEFAFRQMQEKMRQQQQQQMLLAQSTNQQQPPVAASKSPDQQQPQSIQQPHSNPPHASSMPPHASSMPPQTAFSATSQPEQKAPAAQMAQARRVLDQEQFQRAFLSLPDEPSAEICNQLRAKSAIFRDKSDDDIRAFVAQQKSRARQAQFLQQQQQRHQQQQKNLPNMQNGQTLNATMSNQPPQGLQAQSHVPATQSSASAMKQQITGVSNTPMMAQTKYEQGAVESRRTGPQHATNPSTEAQKVVSDQSTTTTQAAKTTQPGQPQHNAVPGSIDNAKLRRFQQLGSEIRLACQSGPAQDMTPQTMAKMRSVLTQIQPYLPMKIMNHLFYYFSHVDPGNEAPLKQFFISRIALVEQFQDEKCTILKDRFTMPLETAEKTWEMFKMLSNKVRQHEMRIKGANAVTQAKAPATTVPSPQVPKPTDVKIMASKPKAERPPDAPTSETPPNSFHSRPSPPQQRPHGVPTYNANMPELTPDRLVIPENKKRKLNNNNTPQAPKPVPVVKPEPMFKCSHPGCEYYRRSFPTGELLARHIEDAHREKEPEDGLQFALEMARIALNLDANGKAIKTAKMEKTASAQTMKKSASTQSQVLKVEGSVSMSRGTTQTSNLGIPRTPQSMGKTWDKATTTASKPEVGKEPLTPDSWADCPVTPTELASLFPLPEAVQGTMDLSGLTPASTLASGKSERNTPNSDVADSNLAVVNEDIDNRIPLSFSNDIFGASEYNSFMDDDPLLDMDWDEAFGSSKKRKTDASGGFNSDLFSFSFPDDEGRITVKESV